MLPLDLLQRPPFALALVASVLAFSGQFVAAVSLPFYFHDALGYSAVQTGLMLTAWPLATGLAAPIAGRWVDRTSARPLTTVGMAMFGTGLILTAAVPMASGPLPLLAALLLTGAGFGLFQAPNNHSILTTAPRERSGAASGLQSTARQLGQSLGAALAALLIGGGTHFDVRPTLWTAAGFATLAAVICAVRGINWRGIDWRGTDLGGETRTSTLPPLTSTLSRCPK
jgi:DHA2 family multidrug resistance protein-like MFS transporter